jgi:hypothetical protein
MRSSQCSCICYCKLLPLSSQLAAIVLTVHVIVTAVHCFQEENKLLCSECCAEYTVTTVVAHTECNHHNVAVYATASCCLYLLSLLPLYSLYMV